jgi:hypothetical protein
LEELAQQAYYGGRFEVGAVGRLSQEIWEYDIHSAYPSQMSKLP